MPFAGLCLENKRGPSCSNISLGEEQLLPARPLRNQSSNCLHCAARLSLHLRSPSQKGEKKLKKDGAKIPSTAPPPPCSPSQVCLKMLLTQRGHRDRHLPQQTTGTATAEGEAVRSGPKKRRRECRLRGEIKAEGGGVEGSGRAGRARAAQENSSGVRDGRDGEATASRDPRIGGSLRPG